MVDENCAGGRIDLDCVWSVCLTEGWFVFVLNFPSELLDGVYPIHELGVRSQSQRGTAPSDTMTEGLLSARNRGALWKSGTPVRMACITMKRSPR